MIPMSSLWLEKNGWVRIDKFVWAKGFDTIKYDGEKWELCKMESICFTPATGLKITWNKIDYIEEVL